MSVTQQNTPNTVARKKTDPRELVQSPRGRRVIAKALINAIKYETALQGSERSASDRDMEFVIEMAFPDLVTILRLEQLRLLVGKVLAMKDASASEKINAMIAQHHKAITKAVVQIQSASVRAIERKLLRMIAMEASAGTKPDVSGGR